MHPCVPAVCPSGTIGANPPADPPVDPPVDPSTVTVTAYDSTDCTGDAVLTIDLENSQDACHSITIQDTTKYGHVYCQDGQPTFYSCEDSDCITCENVPLESSGVCGTSPWDYFGSAMGMCCR